ncbi:ABC transporter ATP-binding protein [Bailinhaonella thermotolerans]|uniref:ABC transporter ATP-binding protein n=1 Tax=Bailinhaonella thermotolerans TaxID=1070861 RepID=A0A3A4ANB4_9ACTN|nr:ABC transporter ATP-binding protein [Bailinhaonella thermotolerans]
MAEIVLSGHGLTKSFGSAVALAGVDLAVAPGEALAIMGPSGSGKSTLLHCLAGIMKPDQGEVRLLGQRIDTMGERQRSELRRTRFGFVFQFGQLLPELPAEENVALPLMLGGASRGKAVEAARRWFGPLGLAGMESRRPGELSGGQAQRVAIARALVTKPAVVFADEPTGALDQATGHDTMRLLVEATKHNHASLIVVTHDPNVARWCDRTVEVRDGRLLVPAAAGAPLPGREPNGGPYGGPARPYAANAGPAEPYGGDRPVAGPGRGADTQDFPVVRP